MRASTWKLCTDVMTFELASRLVSFGNGRVTRWRFSEWPFIHELLASCEDLPMHAGDRVLLQRGSGVALQWVRRCRRGKEP